MKKRLSLLLISVLCLFLLTACGCRHEWQEAGCTAPTTCTRCGETEGEALGHDWTEAGCTAPKTCTRCGETEGEALGHEWTETVCLEPKTCTRCGEIGDEAPGHDWTEAGCTAPTTCNRCGETEGEALGHSYGDWEICADEMLRCCSVCRHKDSAEIDRSFALRQLLEGVWETDYVVEDEQLNSIHDYLYSRPAPIFSFDENGNVSCLYNERYDGCIIELDSYEAGRDPESGTYHFSMLKDGMETSNLSLQVDYSSDGQNTLYYPYLFQTFILSRHDMLDAPLYGPWAAYSEGTIYSLELAEDHSFTGNINGEISGFWLTRPLHEGKYGPCASLIFYYEGEDGSLMSSEAEIYGVNEELDMQEQRNRLSIDVVFRGTGFLEFSYGTEDSLRQSTENPFISGQWQSVSRQDTDSDAPVELTDTYSAVFLDDGTFTAKLDEEIKGSWVLDSISVYYNKYAFRYSHRYVLSTDNEDDSISAYLSSGDKMTLYHFRDGHQIRYDFISSDGEALAAHQASVEQAQQILPGDWTSVAYIFNSFSDVDNPALISKNDFGYSASFFEDGTFTAKLDEEISGTWALYDYSTFSYKETGNDFVCYNYELFADTGESGAMFASILIGTVALDISNQLEVMCRYDDSVYYFRLMPDSEEIVTAYKDTLQQIYGRWEACGSADGAEDARDMGAAPADGYYIEIFEDGTYSSLFNEETSGAWIYLGTSGQEHLIAFYPEDSNQTFIYKLCGDRLECYFTEDRERHELSLCK